MPMMANNIIDSIKVKPFWSCFILKKTPFRLKAYYSIVFRDLLSKIRQLIALFSINVMVRKNFLSYLTFTFWDATTASGACIRSGVAPSSGKHCSALGGRTIPRRCALPCIPKTAHSTLSNCRI
jgi:hypothetical protein